jgi:hypothetical protein
MRNPFRGFLAKGNRHATWRSVALSALVGAAQSASLPTCSLEILKMARPIREDGNSTPLLFSRVALPARL